MPQGYRTVQGAAGPNVPPASLAQPPNPNAGILAQLGITEADLWEHYTLTPAQLAPGTPAVKLNPNGGFSRVLIAVLDAASVYAALNKNAAVTPGAYDLLNPGGSLLAFPVPLTTWLSVLAPTPLAFNVDVWLLGGAYSMRP